MPHLLLVEDSRVLSLMEERHLLAVFPQLTLSIARTGEEAMASAEKRPPDILVVDCHLGGAIGFSELFDGLMASAPRAAVIVTSADPPVELIARQGQGRLVEIIEKPFETDELVSAVGKALDAVDTAGAPGLARSEGAGRAEGTASTAPPFDRHEALNVLTAILTGIRALEADLRAEADHPEGVRSVLAEHIPRLVHSVGRAAAIIKRAPSLNEETP